MRTHLLAFLFVAANTGSLMMVRASRSIFARKESASLRKSPRSTKNSSDSTGMIGAGSGDTSMGIGNTSNARNKLWPPWPFNLLNKPSDEVSVISNGALLVEYLRQRTIFCLQGIQTVSSEAIIHFPPASPAIVMLAVAPKSKFSRNIVLCSLGLSFASWAQDEVGRSRKIRKSLELCNLHTSSILPPFLPDEIEDVDVNLELANDYLVSSQSNTTWVNNLLAKQYNLVTENVNKFHSLKLRRRIQYRRKIMDELQVLKTLKRSGKEEVRNSYALVTGASKGLGRAIAVELARRDINLILVARDIEKLTKLANDLTGFYGVTCHAVKADLSQSDTPSRIFNATRECGLNVDILVNNAGLSTTTNFADESIESLSNVMTVNAMSAMKLSNLYLKEMRHRHFGAILFVSSIVGHVPSVPSASLYAATKAFQRSLALGIGKENEKHGIASCVLCPGAIHGTEFSSTGKMDDSLFWRFPFYSRSPEFVAGVGIRALAEGKFECIPGWQNRALVRVLQPMMPQRLIISICQVSWQPLRQSLPLWLGGFTGSDAEDVSKGLMFEGKTRNRKKSPLVIELPEPLSSVSPLINSDKKNETSSIGISSDEMLEDTIENHSGENESEKFEEDPTEIS